MYHHSRAIRKMQQHGDPLLFTYQSLPSTGFVMIPGDRVQAVLKAKGGHTMYYKNIVASHQHKDSIFKFCRQRTTEISVQKLKKHCSVCVNTVLYWLLIVATNMLECSLSKPH